jgi:uncharacterized protein
MSYEALAFFTGLFGSLHCVAMCGPLILGLPFSNQSIWLSILQRLLYQAGRILMYGFLGILIGLIGTGFSLLKMQQALSVITGMLLIIAGSKHFIKGQKHTNSIFSWKFLPFLTSLLGKYLRKPYGGFIAGAVNGILPCGVTYIALAQAINLTTPIEAGRFMLFFGLGTVPLLFITALTPLFFRKFKTPVLLIPVLFLLAGSFLMARGLNLSIPYVSHSINLNEPANCK